MWAVMLCLVVIWGGFLYGYVAIKVNYQVVEHMEGTDEVPSYPQAVFQKTFKDP